jgi:hypothetical protein
MCCGQISSTLQRNLEIFLDGNINCQQALMQSMNRLIRSIKLFNSQMPSFRIFDFLGSSEIASILQ